MNFYKSIRPLISVLYAKGYHDFPLKNFRLTVPKKFVEEPFCISDNFCYRKMLRIRERGVSRFSVENFLSHNAKNLRRGTLQCFIKFGYRKISCLWREYYDFLWKICCLTVWYRKSLWIKGGVSQFPVKIVLSHSTESFHRGTLLCSRNFRESNNFTPKTGISRFSIKKVCRLTVPKNFVREFLCAVFQKISGGQKVYG